jgi:4-aminobutyrate aminotransferase-like enzyme
LQRRAQTLGPAYRLFYEESIHASRADGVWIFDADGRRYLDVYNNVAAVGHGHPDVVAALASQAAVLATHTRYVEEHVLDYAEQLLALFPQPLSRAMLTCTGSEANDLALRIASASTGGTGVIVTRMAYHGVTSAMAQISPSLGNGVPLGSYVRTIDAPDSYRNPNVDIGEAFKYGVKTAIEDLQRHGIQPAALIVDTIFSSDGVFADPAGFLAPAVEEIRSAGGVFIADEVQAGFGRTGTHMWGFERHGLIPDIVTLGKPMGNGYPMAGVVSRPELIDAFAATSRYFNTFAGNPVASAVGSAVLNVIHNERLLENVRDIGAYLKAGLDNLKESFDVVGDVRAAGFFLGVELVTDKATKTASPEVAHSLVNLMRNKGVLISATGPWANVLKLRPQLIFRREHADLFLEQLKESLLDIKSAHLLNTSRLNYP